MRNPILPLLLVIAVMAGFYGGWKYSQSRIPVASASTQTVVLPGAAGGGTAANGTSGTSGPPGGGGGGFGRGGVTGAITAVGTGTLTLHDAASNADVKVSYTGSTPILKSSQAQVSDLTAGTSIVVTGQRGSDGTIAATAIQIGGPRAGG